MAYIPIETFLAVIVAYDVWDTSALNLQDTLSLGLVYPHQTCPSDVVVSMGRTLARPCKEQQ
jgi:hypothetical protein